MSFSEQFIKTNMQETNKNAVQVSDNETLTSADIVSRLEKCITANFNRTKMYDQKFVCDLILKRKVLESDCNFAVDSIKNPMEKINMHYMPVASDNFKIPPSHYSVFCGTNLFEPEIEYVKCFIRMSNYENV